MLSFVGMSAAMMSHNCNWLEKFGGVVWKLRISLINWALISDTVMSISWYSHLSSQEHRVKLRRWWKKQWRFFWGKVDSSRFSVTLPGDLEEPGPYIRAKSASEWLCSAWKWEAKRTRRELVMSSSWMKPKLLLEFQHWLKEETCEPKLLAQTVEDNPEWISSVHCRSCMKDLRSCWEGRFVEILWRQLINTVGNKHLGDARKALGSAEKNHPGYSFLQASSLAKALGEKKKKKRKFLLR